MNDNKKFGDNYATRNPNFGKITALKNIELAQDPILWPFVKLEVYENGIQGGKATSRAIVPLFLFGREGNNDGSVLRSAPIVELMSTAFQRIIHFQPLHLG